jgi:hypothetical protein
MSRYEPNPHYIQPKVKSRWTGFDIEQPPIPLVHNGYLQTVPTMERALKAASLYAESKNQPITIWHNAKIVGVMHPEQETNQ